MDMRYLSGIVLRCGSLSTGLDVHCTGRTVFMYRVCRVYMYRVYTWMHTHRMYMIAQGVQGGPIVHGGPKYIQGGPIVQGSPTQIQGGPIVQGGPK